MLVDVTPEERDVLLNWKKHNDTLILVRLKAEAILYVKPRVLWRLVYLVVVVWGRGRSTTSRAVASAPVAVWWVCSCSTGVSIPIAE